MPVVSLMMSCCYFSLAYVFFFINIFCCCCCCFYFCCTSRGFIVQPENVQPVEFTYHVFTRMTGVSYRRRLGSLLCLCDVFRALIISLVCLCVCLFVCLCYTLWVAAYAAPLLSSLVPPPLFAHLLLRTPPPAPLSCSHVYGKATTISPGK